MKEKIKKVITTLLITVGIITVGSTTNVVTKADTFSVDDTASEPLIFDQAYTGLLSESIGNEDEYLLSVPADGKIAVNCYSDQWISYCITDLKGYHTYDANSFGYGEKYKYFCYLKGGTYLLTISGSSYEDSTYELKCEFDFHTSTSAKVSSPAKSSLKITAPKNGGKIDGFEIRYKKVNSNDWIVKKISGNKNLNKTIKGLKRGASYLVQTRMYVTDSYGYTYYSDWTKNKSVKIK